MLLSRRDFRKARTLLRLRTPIDDVLQALGHRYTVAQLKSGMEEFRIRVRERRKAARVRAHTEAPVDHVARNEAFCAAMREAAVSGRERVSFGIVKDDSPLMVRRLYAPPRGFGNSALG